MTHSTEVFTCHCGAIFKCQYYLKCHQRRMHADGSVKDQGDLQVTKRSRIEDRQPIRCKLFKEEKEPLDDHDDSPFDPMELLKMQVSIDEAA
jgi:hypothetical protein